MLTNFLKYLSIEKNYSAQTVRSYGDDLKQFFSYCQVNPDSTNDLQIPPRTIRAWLSHLLETNCTPRTVNRKLSSLRKFYWYLCVKGIIDKNPLNRVVAPQTSKRLPEFLKPTETDLLLDGNYFSDDFWGLRDLLVVAVFYFTGIRVSELVNLTIANIDTGNSVLKVLGKGSKERLVPIHAELKAMIEDYLNQRSMFPELNHSPYLIVSNSGNQTYPQLLYRIVKRYVAMVSTIDKKSPHVLRHTFATQLLNKGADINAIKELLGHANLSATQIYTHTSFEKLKKTYAQAHPRA